MAESIKGVSKLCEGCVVRDSLCAVGAGITALSQTVKNVGGVIRERDRKYLQAESKRRLGVYPDGMTDMDTPAGIVRVLADGCNGSVPVVVDGVEVDFPPHKLFEWDNKGAKPVNNVSHRALNDALKTVFDVTRQVDNQTRNPF